MTSRFTRLTPLQEQTADRWQTTPLRDHPHAVPGFATVVAALEQHYLPAEHWGSWLNKGSVTFRHKSQIRWQVRVFIDDGRLAATYGLSFGGGSVVIGIDLTDRDPFERHVIREYLKTHRYYMNPEAGAKKIQLVTPQRHEEHWLEVVFLPPGTCDMPVDETRVTGLIASIEDGQDTPE